MSKESEKFEKKLLNILNSSANAKAWSDLLPITKEILSHLKKYNKDIDFATISNKYMLSKRLAQCLNPEFPHGVHEVVLEIYKILISNIMLRHDMKLLDNLSLYACGLFPFFANASIQNKKKFLNDIIKENLLSLNISELTECFPGLLASLIPGLDENNESTSKEIYQAFDDFIVKLGKKNFFGIYWTLILRNEHLRESGMKYLIEKLPKYFEYIKLSEDEKLQLINDYYPNINTVVVNSLCEVIKENNIPIVRNGMDFIISRFPLIKNNNMINDKAKINLIISVLKLLAKNEYSTVRRADNWLLDIYESDDDSKCSNEDMNYKMSLLIEAFKNIFSTIKIYSKEELLNNLLVIENLLNNQKNITNFILPQISYFILKCAVNYWHNFLNESENVNDNDIINKISTFFGENQRIKILWKSLADSLENSVKEINEYYNNKINDNNNEVDKDKEEENDNNYVLNKISEIIPSLKFSLIFIEMKSNDGRISYYIPIVTHLLNIMKKIKVTNRNCLKQIKNIILINLVFMKSLQEKRLQNDEEMSSISKQLYGTSSNELDEKLENEDLNVSFRPSVFQEMSKAEDIMYTSLYEDNNNLEGKYNINDESTLNHILNINNNYSKIIEQLSIGIIFYQKCYVNVLNEFFNIKKDMPVTKYEINILKQSSELMLRLQEYAQQKEIPGWWYSLEKIIFNNDVNTKISLEIINFILDLNMSSFNDSDIFKKIKANFIFGNVDSSEIDKNYIENIIKKTGAKKNCFELIISKLYLTLNEQTNQKTILDLLIKATKIDLTKFEKIINNTFNINNFDSAVESIKQFSEFWKLVNEYYSDKFDFKNNECVFKMIDYLEHKNPLLRHLSKVWLTQVNQQFNKILDPIIIILLEEKIPCIIENNKIIIEREFNTSIILDAFNKLKNIILNSQVIIFLKEEETSEKIKNINIFNNFKLDNFNYLKLLINISLHFTQIQCNENLIEEFKREISCVNAASCEFLELLIRLTNDGEMLIEIANEINKSIFNLLDKAIEENDEVMQVQLLNVIKSLDFNDSIQSDDEKLSYNKNLILNLIKENSLIKILVKGMSSEYYFVREHFINFTNDCLTIFDNIMEEQKNSGEIYGIYSKFLSALINYLFKIITIQKTGSEYKFSHFDSDNNKIIFKNYLESYKEYKIYDENDALLILKGIKNIILHFLNYEIVTKPKSKSLTESTINFKPLSFFKIKSLNNDKHKNALNQSFKGNWSDFKKNLNLGLQNNIFNFLDENSLDSTEKTTIMKNNNTLRNEEDFSLKPKNINNNQIYNLINVLVLTWINQSDKYEVYDYCLNINGILAPTEIDKWNDLSSFDIKNVQEMINNQPIKKVIIEIGSNLFKSSSVEFIEKLLDLWCFGFNNENNNINATIDKQFQLSIIEILISLEIPTAILLYCINIILQKKIKNIDNKNKKYKKDAKSKMYITPYEYSLYEAKIFHFIYSFILLNPLNNINNSEITEIWKELNNIFYTMINSSKILYSFCWMYELMQLSLEKFKYQDIENNEVKKSISDIFNIITSKLMDSSFENKTDSKYFDAAEKLVLPVLPHIYTNIIKAQYEEYNLYKKDTGNDQNKKTLEEENIDENLEKRSISSKINANLFNENDTINENKNMFYAAPVLKEKGKLNKFYIEYCRDVKSCSEYNCENNNEDEKKASNITILNDNDNDINKDDNINNKSISYESPEANNLNKYYRRFALITLKENFYKLCYGIFGDNLNNTKKYITDILKGLISLMKSKDTFYVECATEFLASLMELNSKNITICGKNMINEYLNDDSFFKTSSINLHNWKKIISNYEKNYSDIITDLINNIDNNKFLFSKTNDNDKIRILRRISFVIYSCKSDTFSKNFDIIQAKAKDLLSASIDKIIESEIFLILRILFLRFSHDGVMKMIRDLWPIIFMELIQNIKSESRKKHINLVSESFKFIELLSLANIEEFSLYQWIFILDTYDINNLDLSKEESLINKVLSKNDPVFMPLALNILNLQGNNNKLLEGRHRGKSQLFINTKNGTMEELQNGVKKFFFSIEDMNSYKVSVNFEQIEQMIEQDFIN